MTRQPAKDTLFYAERKVDLARQVQASVGADKMDIVPMEKGDLAKFGGDLVAVPARPHADQSSAGALGKIESTVQTGAEAIEKQGKKVEKQLLPLPKPNP